MDLQLILTFIYKFLVNKKDKDLLQYSFLLSGFLYFSQGYSLGQCLSIGIIFGVILYGIKYDYLNLIPEKNKNKDILLSDKVTSSLNPDKLTNNLNIDNEQNKNLKLNLTSLRNSIKNIAKFLVNMRKITKDSGYTDIIIEITKLIQTFTQQIDIIIKNINSDNSYTYLSYEKLKDIEKEILFQVNSLYFKNDENFDIKINELIKKLDDELKEMNKTIIDIVNNDYELNINSSKKIINDIDEPNAYNQ